MVEVVDQVRVQLAERLAEVVAQQAVVFRLGGVVVVVLVEGVVQFFGRHEAALPPGEWLLGLGWIVRVR